MDQNKYKTTAELTEMAFKGENIGSLKDNRPEYFNPVSFAEYIRNRCKAGNITAGSVIDAANLAKSYGHKLFKGTSKPSRDAVIRLAIAFGADVAETQKMLRAAEKNELYSKAVRDYTIMYCLENHLSFADTQLALEEDGVPILGGCKDE